ncbi:hypothetical protein D3C71_544580 [compost metagenome]
MNNHHCKNCASELNGNYCSNCGQSADTHKLNFHYMWHDIQHGLLHFDKGIFYSIKELYTRPGHSVREFLDGKRVKHFKPLSMVIVLATVYAFLFHILHLDHNTVISIQDSSPKPGMNPMNFSKWITDHYALSRLMSIPLLALTTWICFYKQKRNFVELLILTAFVTAQSLILMIVTLPITYFLKHTETASYFFNFGLQLVEFVLFAWTYIQFFNKLHKFRAFLQALLSLLLYIILLFLIAAITILVIGMFTFS